MNDTNNYKRLFYSGKLYDGYRYFGCHIIKEENAAQFRVWAPRAKRVCVVGDFNNWDENSAVMENSDGIWSIKIKGVKEFDGYKYLITTPSDEKRFKSDPYAFHSETHGGTNSKVYNIDNFKFSDEKWAQKQKDANIYSSPINIYEAHIGSWRKYADGNVFSYRAFADEIAPYLKKMNYTHIELMGLAEYPFDGSWGYQVTGYFAPTSRYGTPADFAYLVNKLHENNIGVIADWVPGHFPKDANGLYEFDGLPLYEPDDELKKEHKEWGTRCFDYGRTEVKSFLISNALYWFDVFHIDGLRVDAVASMLYLNYNRKEYRPNRHGGIENLDAIEFFQNLNSAVFEKYPSALMIAEESTAWPLVTKPVSAGGLGFNFKWNMGWMNDTLSYAKTDPYFRAGKHNNLTFSMSYAFSENYILPISHDEVVHGKGSLLNKMPGFYDQKFAGWRNYLMNMVSHPGKKLIFMGTEFGQFIEWDFAKELDWGLLSYPAHQSAQKFVETLNGIYLSNPPLYEIEDDWSGFRWLVADDNKQNIIVYERRDKAGNRLLAVYNFSPVEYKNYEFGCEEGTFTTILSSDEKCFSTEKKIYKTYNKTNHDKNTSLQMDIAPMSGVYMVCKAKKKAEPKNALAGKKSHK